MKDLWFPNPILQSPHPRILFLSSPGDFPSGSVAQTPHSQFREPGFNPWAGN